MGRRRSSSIAGSPLLIGAITTLIAGYFGSTRVHFTVDSTAFQDGIHTHSFQDTRDLMNEVFWARIYAGFHFYHSLEDGRDMGMGIAHQLLRNHFRSARPEALR